MEEAFHVRGVPVPTVLFARTPHQVEPGIVHEVGGGHLVRSGLRQTAGFEQLHPVPLCVPRFSKVQMFRQQPFPRLLPAAVFEGAEPGPVLDEIAFFEHIIGPGTNQDPFQGVGGHAFLEPLFHFAAASGHPP